METTDYNPQLPETAQENTDNLVQETGVTAAGMPAESASPKTVLSAGEWLRAVSDFRAPFGFDRLPTVWG